VVGAVGEVQAAGHHRDPDQRVRQAGVGDGLAGRRVVAHPDQRGGEDAEDQAHSSPGDLQGQPVA
jgi:hypothetical protein